MLIFIKQKKSNYNTSNKHTEWEKGTLVSGKSDNLTLSKFGERDISEGKKVII
jgi:hypothetical protein